MSAVDDGRPTVALPVDHPTTGPSGPRRRDVGGRVTLVVVAALAAGLAVVATLWPAAAPTPSDDRAPSAEQNRALGDLPFTAVVNGLGPVARDRANGGADLDDGGPITIADRVYDRGLGVHAPSQIRLYPAGVCDRFVADLGLDATAGTAGSVVFQVLADDVAVFVSERLTGQDPPHRVELPIGGVDILDLVVTDGGDGTDGDAAAWADAALVCHG